MGQPLPQSASYHLFIEAGHLDVCRPECISLAGRSSGFSKISTHIPTLHTWRTRFVPFYHPILLLLGNGITLRQEIKAVGWRTPSPSRFPFRVKIKLEHDSPEEIESHLILSA